jgi:hypothetical protein
MSPTRTPRATSTWCLLARCLLGGVRWISGLPVRFLPIGARDCRHALSGKTCIDRCAPFEPRGFSLDHRRPRKAYITCRGRSHWQASWKRLDVEAALVRMQFVKERGDRGMLLVMMH